MKYQENVYCGRSYIWIGNFHDLYDLFHVHGDIIKDDPDSCDMHAKYQ